jgi:hypothetical protein
VSAGRAEGDSRAGTMRGPTTLPASMACCRPTSFQSSRTEVADRGEAGHQRFLRVRHRDRRPEAVVELQILYTAVGRIAVDVHMHVDQTGHDAHAIQRDATRLLRRRLIGGLGRDRDDTTIANQHTGLFDPTTTADIQQALSSEPSLHRVGVGSAERGQAKHARKQLGKVSHGSSPQCIVLSKHRMS